MSVTPIKCFVAWQVLLGFCYLSLALVPALASADSAGREGSSSGSEPRLIQVDAVPCATASPALQTGPASPDCAGAERQDVNESQLSSEFVQEVEKVLREFNSTQMSTALRILPAAFHESDVEHRITDRAGRGQKPIELADLAAEGRVCKIVRVGPETTADVAADAPDDASPARVLKELPRGYRITEVLDATDSIDLAKLGLPKSTKVAAVRLVPTSDDRPPLKTVVPVDSRIEVRMASFEQAEPEASETPKPVAKPAPKDTAEAAKPVAEAATDQPSEIPAPKTLAELNFQPITNLTVDIETKLDPQVADHLQEPESLGEREFLAHGEEPDIPRVGGVGLDEGVFLASGVFCHQPLYFEEANLERYGNSYCRLLQPAFSGYRFFASVPAIPYMMAIYRPRKCYYDSSPYLAGRAAPRHDESLPVTWMGAATEMNAITALIFLFPP